MLQPADRAAMRWQRLESDAEVPGSLPTTWTDQTSVDKQTRNRNIICCATSHCIDQATNLVQTEKSHELYETW